MTESGSFDLKSAPPVETTRSSPVDAKEIQPRGAEIKKNIPSLDEKSIRLVVFSLAGQTNAVDVDQVEEIILGPKVSPLLKAPFFVEGVIIFSHGYASTLKGWIYFIRVGMHVTCFVTDHSTVLLLANCEKRVLSPHERLPS